LNSECIPIPGSTGYVLGLINLRGKVISVIDLKMKMFKIKNDVNQSVKRSIMITETEGLTIGCVVDYVAEVISLREDQIDQKLDILIAGEKEFCKGIAQIENRPMILILNLAKSLSANEVIKLKAS
jgi:purine-binding chemotaxis protein CheW